MFEYYTFMYFIIILFTTKKDDYRKIREATLKSFRSSYGKTTSFRVFNHDNSSFVNPLHPERLTLKKICSFEYYSIERTIHHRNILE
jgi:hypothetical protein